MRPALPSTEVSLRRYKTSSELHSFFFVDRVAGGGHRVIRSAFFNLCFIRNPFFSCWRRISIHHSRGSSSKIHPSFLKLNHGFVRGNYIKISKTFINSPKKYRRSQKPRRSHSVRKKPGPAKNTSQKKRILRTNAPTLLKTPSPSYAHKFATIPCRQYQS